jgi:hypothetical protein
VRPRRSQHHPPITNLQHYARSQAPLTATDFFTAK